MKTPIMHDFTRNILLDYFQNHVLQVGDTVYYLSARPAYSIRKSTIAAMKHIPPNHHSNPLGRTELTLANGAIVEYNDVFDSKERVLEFIVADLKSSLLHHRNGLKTLQQEIVREERQLEIYEKQLEKTS